MNLRSKIPFFLASIKYDKAQPIWLEYIESSGTQYINTGVSGDVTIKATAQQTQHTGQSQILFASTASGKGGTYFGTPLTEKNWGCGTGTGNLTSIQATTKADIDITFTSAGITGSVNGENISRSVDVTQGQWFIFSAATGLYRGRFRLWNAKLYQNNVLVRDLRPCLDHNGIACMYDMISKQYLYNQGTGEFIPAPRFVEYIQSTGTQYIDTGIKGTDITRFVIKGTCVENGVNNTQLLGGTNSSSQTFFGTRYSNNVAKWYCVNSKGASIGNPHNLSIIDATIESNTSQYGTLTDLIDGTVSEFVKLSGNAWGFSESNLLIFGGYSSRRSPNATCYDLQLYTSDGLVRHFRPCLRGNTPCMFDMVTGQYFYNQGEGEFEK